MAEKRTPGPGEWPPERAMMPPRDRLGEHRPPHDHASRDTPIVSRNETAELTPETKVPGLNSSLSFETGIETIVESRSRVNRAALLSTTGAVEPPFPGPPAPASIVAGRLTIITTPYPSDPAASLVVSGYVRIDTRSAEYREFNSKIDRIIGLLADSNEIAGDTREQLLAEIKAGMSILSAPNADPNLIKVLLEQPLLWIAGAAGTGIIGGLAYDAVQLLTHMISATPILPL